MSRKEYDMNIHEANCRKLKAIRKRLADTLDVELYQRECTNSAGCTGTCPKCAQEEKKLNDALLKRGAVGAVAAALSLGLAGCTPADLAKLAETMSRLPGINRGSGTQNNPQVRETAAPETEPEIDDLTGEVDLPEPQETEEEYQLTGDVAYVPDDNWLTGMVPCESVEYYDE